LSSSPQETSCWTPRLSIASVSATRPPLAFLPCSRIHVELPTYTVVFREEGKAGTVLPTSWRGGVRTTPHQCCRKSPPSVHDLIVIRTRVVRAGEDLRYSSSSNVDCIVE
jgi:hypothetical protein